MWETVRLTNYFTHALTLELKREVNTRLKVGKSYIFTDIARFLITDKIGNNKKRTFIKPYYIIIQCFERKAYLR